MSTKIDKGFLLVTLFLIGLGVVQVYSSSFIFAIESFGDGLYFFRRQLIFSIVGVLILLATTFSPWKLFEKSGFLIWMIAVLGVGLTFLPGLGVKVGGAHRWLQLPLGFRFEPAELLKISFPLMMAFYVAKNEEDNSLFRKIFWLILLSTPLVLLLKQPDFGSFAICGFTVISILFVFGLKWRYILGAATLAVPAFYFLVVQVPYRWARIAAFLDPWSDPEAKGFQVIQSMLSFHSGGLWGKGLGVGQGKLFFLPEAHNDFTLAVLGEELGFLGFVFVILLYGFLVFRGLQISTHATSKKSQAIAIGVTLVLAISTVINVGVVLGALPTKGLALPFLSYGGSSLVSTCFGVGLLLNIDRQNRQSSKRRFNGYKV